MPWRNGLVVLAAHRSIIVVAMKRLLPAILALMFLGAPGTNGPIVVFLYGPVAAGGGPIDGMIAHGTFTAANLIGPLAGHPFSELLAAMRSGNAYVNVHTDDGIAPANTGPGDFPGGEIRGLLVDKHED